MKNLVIIGAGDLGKEVVWLIEDINRREPTYLILGFLDDDLSKNQKEFFGYRILGGTELLESLNETMRFSAVIAIQDGSVRKKIVEQHPTFQKWQSIIHPTAVIAPTSQIGDGSIVFPNVTVSVDNQIGRFGLYYIHATVCNDCKIGDYVSVLSGASVSEHVEIGDECYLAAGSCVYPHKRLGKRVHVAVAATACKDYDDAAEVSDKGTGFSLFK